MADCGGFREFSGISRADILTAIEIRPPAAHELRVDEVWVLYVKRALRLEVAGDRRTVRSPAPTTSARLSSPRNHAPSGGAAAGIYDLASLVLGGPMGRELCGEAFKNAKDLVVDRCGDLAKLVARQADDDTAKLRR